MRFPASSSPRKRPVACGVLLGVMALFCAPLYTGCLDNSCVQVSEEPVTYTDGTTNAARTFYTSATGNKRFLRFPAGRIFRMEHGLGRTPDTYEAFVSFLADGGDHATGAGNLALLNVNDRYIQVQNNTCTDLFVKVTATVETDPDTSESPSDLDAAIETEAPTPDAQPATTGDAN